MVGPEPQLACLHGSTPRVQTERELGIARVPISSTTMRPAIGGRRILVIGAGIAGLGAARALHDLGYEVEVVEARERLGGRICTVDRIDYGAHWIHGTEGNPITQLARMLELPTLFVGGDSTYTGGWQQIEFRSGGTAEFGEEEKRQSILAADELLERLDQWRERSSEQNGASVAEAVRAVQEANPQWSEEQRRHMAWHVELWSRDDCAAGADALSARYWDEGYELYGDGDSVFWNGYQSLVERLAKGLKVRLGCPVAHISSNGSQGSGVRVQTAQGELTADAVLVTLPLGVLQANAVTFDPPLPASRVEATARLGVGTLAKLAYEFDEVFWPRNQYVFGMVQDPAKHPTMIINLWSSHRQPCLMLLAGGSLGLELERMPEGDAQAWGMAILRQCFGGAVPEPRSHHRTSWSVDPYARGAYTFIAAGATPADIRALQEPVGERIFFAGEATSAEHWGTVHGAYLSGLREAARISGIRSVLPPKTITESRRWRLRMRRAERFFNLRLRDLDPKQWSERVELLCNSEVFGVLASEDLSLLAPLMHPCSLDDGEVLFQQGEQARDAYVVASGQLRVFDPRNGTTIAHLGAGKVIGEYGMFVEHRRTFSACAEGPVRLWAISYPVLHHFMLAYPESVFSLMRQTVTRLLEAMGRSAVPEAVCDSTAGNVVSNPFLSSRTVASSLPRPPQRQEFHADAF
jgi:monoamine oxidase/CRP-like cAMP-binding protein